MNLIDVKEWFANVVDRQKNIDIIINSHLREEERIYKAWEKALNNLIDKHRSSDGKTYMRYRDGKVYVAAEKADVFITPSISDCLYTDLTCQGKIRGINCIKQQRCKKEVGLLYTSIIKITDDIEIITKDEFFKVYNKIMKGNE